MQEAADKVKMIFKANINFEAAKTYLESLTDSFGNKRLTNLQIMRTLALTNCCAKHMTKEDCKKTHLKTGSHWASSNFLQIFYNNYTKLLTLLEGNELISFEFREKKGKNGEIKKNIVRIATVNPKYIEDCEIDLPEKDYNHMIVFIKKTRKYGNTCSYNENISIDISREKFDELVSAHLMVKYSDKSPEQLQEDLETQWSVVTKINSCGRIDPHRTKDGRNHSRITQISHPVDDFIQIDNEETVEFDQHATYFTLIPEVLRARVSDKSPELDKELANLELLIENTPNIYKYISNSIFISMKEIKKEVNKFFCEPKAIRTFDSCLFSFFNKEFPEISRNLNVLRTKKGAYSEFQKIESKIFSGSARELLKLGIPAITKYDSLIVKMKDSEIAKKILNEKFKEHNVKNRTKTNKEIKITEKLKENKRPKIIKDNKVKENKDNYIAPSGRSQPQEAAGAGTSYCPYFLSSGTKWTIDRPTNITTLIDGRFRVSIKHKKYNSKMNETLEMFKERIFLLTNVKV